MPTPTLTLIRVPRRDVDLDGADGTIALCADMAAAVSMAHEWRDTHKTFLFRELPQFLDRSVHGAARYFAAAEKEARETARIAAEVAAERAEIAELEARLATLKAKHAGAVA